MQSMMGNNGKRVILCEEYKILLYCNAEVRIIIHTE